MTIFDGVTGVLNFVGSIIDFVCTALLSVLGIIGSLVGLIGGLIGLAVGGLLLYVVWLYVKRQGYAIPFMQNVPVMNAAIPTTATVKKAVAPVDLPPHDVVSIATDKLKKVILENGLTVLVCQQRNAPKVLVQIGYDVGSAIESAGERGLAHLLEHMIFKGTEKLAEGDIDAIARKYGADFNAFTSNDMTSYFFETDSQNWEYFLPVLADCMQNARFSDQHLASEVKAVIQELRMYKDSHWHMMFEHAFATMFPANHPYHFPIIGYKEDLADLSGARLKAFYDKYYHPSRAVLCIVGDIDIDDAIAKAEAAFAGIVCNASEHTPAFIPLHNNLTSTSAVMYKEVHDEQLGVYWRIPGVKSGTHLIASAIEYILGGGLDSRLYRLLVDELQIASSVRVGAEQMVDAGIFLITVEPKVGKADQCKAVIIEQMNTVIAEGFEEVELYKMVKNRQRQHMLALHNLHDFVYHWLESYFITRNEFDFFNEANEYARLTLSELKGFAAQWLNPRDMHSILLCPLPEAAKAIWSAEQAKEEEYYAYLLDRHKRTEPLGEGSYVYTLPAAKPLVFNFPQPTRIARQLNSDLTIISYTDRSLPLVSVALVFKDAAYIARALDGVGVDVMMSLLLEGSKGLQKQQIVEFFDLNGAQYAYNGRGMSLLVGTSSFSSVFAHGFNVLMHPAFTQQAFEKIRDIYVHSYQQKKDSARQVAMRTLKQAIYYKHPYGWSFDEAITYLQNMTLAEVIRLHQQYVRPSKMVLSVAGDVDPSFVEQLAIQMTTDWPAGHHVAPVYPERQVPELKQVVVPMLRDQMVLAFGRPSSVSLYEPAHIMLDLLSHICFNSLGSRLYALREQTGLFYTASGSWGADVHQEDGYDYVCAIVSPENMAFAEQAILNLLATMTKEEFDADELSAARQMYCKEMIDAAADVRSLASLFANIEILGIGYDYYDKALRYVYELKLAELNDYARDYISADRFVSVIVGRVGVFGEKPEYEEEDELPFPSED
ncbi:MAG: zinc protease [Candidatus Dependentiae bacterium]|nr:zinc protease [Candidatus Dependentiae bacterium]